MLYEVVVHTTERLTVAALTKQDAKDIAARVTLGEDCPELKAHHGVRTRLMVQSSIKRKVTT